MFVYPADPDEVKALRTVWGSSVVSATFWDAEDPQEAIEVTGSRWELAEGFSAAGRLIGQLQPGEAGWEHLEDVLEERGETVKFGLQIVGD